MCNVPLASFVLFVSRYPYVHGGFAPKVKNEAASVVEFAAVHFEWYDLIIYPKIFGRWYSYFCQ